MAYTRLRMDELVNAWVGNRNTPFQIGLLALFDAGPFAAVGGGADVRAVADELARRALGIPELRRRIVWTHLGEGLPVWFDDPDSDPARLVAATRLAPDTDLPTWAANRTVVPSTGKAPCGGADVVDRGDGRFAVLVVVHHLLVDGLAGVRLLLSLLDTEPDAVRIATALPPREPLPTHRALMADRLQSWQRAPAGVADAPFAEGLPGGPRRSGGARRTRRALAEYREAMDQLRAPLPSTSLPRTVGPTRRMAVATADLAAVHEAATARGATINDLALAAVTDGMRALLLARGECRPGLFVRAVVPVATDPSGQTAGMMLVDLPVGDDDPVRRLRTIIARTSERKRRLRAGRGTGNGILGLPVPVARIVVPWARRRGSAHVHLSVTNVPGPRGPLWFAGARMTQAVPVAPLVDLVGLTVAVLSYDGRLVVAVNADGSMGDLDVLGDGVEASLAGVEATPPA